MNNYTVTSVTFLSGLSADWSPIGPRAGQGALSPIGPGHLSPWSPIGPGHLSPWSPIGPGHHSLWSPIGPGHLSPWSPIGPGRSSASSSPFGAEAADSAAMPAWQGIDPEWVYADGSTMLAQALRKSRAKTVRMSDPVAMDAVVVPRDTGVALRQALWRWAPEFRMMAVTGELLSRVQAHGLSVWLTEPPRPDGSCAGPATLLLELPASLDAVDWQAQVDDVIRAAVEREDRLPEILSQATSLWAFFESITGVSLQQAPAFGELLLAAEDWALKILMLLKHNVAARRPVHRSSLVRPVIATPGHGSLPSGHATMAAMNTELLRLMMYPGGPSARVDALDRLARRIAFNRVVAGMHFPVDSQAGYALGHQLARVLAALAGHPTTELRSLAASDVIYGEHKLPEIAPVANVGTSQGPARARPPAISPSRADALALLWEQAALELSRLRV